MRYRADNKRIVLSPTSAGRLYDSYDRVGKIQDPNAGMRVILFLTFMLFVAMKSIVPYMDEWLKNSEDYSEEIYPFLQISEILSKALFNMFSGKILKKIGLRTTALLGVAFDFGGSILLALVCHGVLNNVIFLMVGRIFDGLAYVLIVVVIFAFIREFSQNESHRKKNVSNYTLAFSCATVFGPGVTAFIPFGIYGVSIFMCTVPLLSVFVLLAYFPFNDISKSAREQTLVERTTRLQKGWSFFMNVTLSSLLYPVVYSIPPFLLEMGRSTEQIAQDVSIGGGLLLFGLILCRFINLSANHFHLLFILVSFSASFWIILTPYSAFRVLIFGYFFAFGQLDIYIKASLTKFLSPSEIGYSFTARAIVEIFLQYSFFQIRKDPQTLGCILSILYIFIFSTSIMTEVIHDLLADK